MDQDDQKNLNDLPRDLLLNILLGCKKGCNPRGICKDINVIYDHNSILNHLLLSGQPFFIILQNIIQIEINDLYTLDTMKSLIDAAMTKNYNGKKHIINAWGINFLIGLYGWVGTDKSAFVVKAFAENIQNLKFRIPDDEVKPLLYHLIWEDLDQKHTFNMCDNPLPEQSTNMKWREQKVVLIKALIDVKPHIIFKNIDNAGILSCFVALEWKSVTSVNPMYKFGPLPLMHNGLYTLLRTYVEELEFINWVNLGPSIGKSLILAAAIGSLKIVEALITNKYKKKLELDLDLDLDLEIHLTLDDLQVALEMAITYDHLDLVKYLLTYIEKGSNVPLISPKGILVEGSFSGEPMMRASGFNANIAGYKPANTDIMKELVLTFRGNKPTDIMMKEMVLTFLENDPMKYLQTLNEKPKNKPVYLSNMYNKKVQIIKDVIGL